MQDEANDITFSEAEFVCRDEKGVVNLVPVIQHFQRNCAFIKIKLSYDVHQDNISTHSSYLNPSSCIESDRKLSYEGFQALTFLFQCGVMGNLIEFRLTDFHVDSVPFLMFLDCLIGNTQLVILDFCRDDISQDTAMCVIQKLY
jgi:hypothetical protein